MNENRVQFIASEVVEECRRARVTHPPFNSGHEGYAVILEEMDELWDELKKKKALRDYAKIKHEAHQVAAMAICFIDEVGPWAPTRPSGSPAQRGTGLHERTFKDCEGKEFIFETTEEPDALVLRIYDKCYEGRFLRFEERFKRNHKHEVNHFPLPLRRWP